MLKITYANYTNIRVRTVEQWKKVNDQLTKKIKGTIFEKWVQYWKQIVRDYGDVTISLKQEIKDKPLKSTVYFTGIGLFSYCATHNPNLQHFRAKYVQCANDLALISPSVANPESVNHLKYIESCFNRNLIRHTNLGIASIIWIDDFSSECSTYESKCSYLQVPYRRFSDHIVDVGFLNTWWNISKKMLDYDINY